MNNTPAGSQELREAANGLTEGISQKLVEVIPGVHPNHITIASTFLACGAEVLWSIAERKRWPKWAMSRVLAAKGVSYAGDVLDGAVARVTGQTSETGAALDASCDRIVEINVALGKMMNAFDRGDTFSAVAFLIYGISCMPPSILRAAIEAKGVQCQESTDPVRWPGSSLARRGEQVLANFLALFLDDNAKRNVELAGAGAVAIGNLAVAADRGIQLVRACNLPNECEDKVLDQEAISAAKLKYAVLGIVGGVCAGALGGVFWHLARRQKGRLLAP